MKLRISAPVTVLDARADGTPVRETARLVALNGAGSSECFSDYLLDNKPTGELPARGVSGGYLHFRFQEARGELWVETEYDLTQKLSEPEINALLDYTLGQWSDGIGENFCPEYAERTGLFPVIDLDHATLKLL